MAAISTLTKILSNINLNKEWAQIQLGTNLHDIFLIAIKEQKGTSDTINVEDVLSIQFEIGIESGIDKEYLTIQRISLNFRDFTSSDENINSKTAFARLSNVPTNFYIRPISVQTVNKQIETGIVSIGINLNPFDLGER